MPKDIVALQATFEGERDKLDKGLAAAVNQELDKQTGLKPEAVTFDEAQQFEVTLYLLKGGELSDETVTGTSTESIDKAFEAADAARANKDYDPARIGVSIDRTVEAEYFTIPVVSRSVRKTRVNQHHEAAVGQLAKTYGARLDRHPDSLSYRVLHSKKKYNSDGVLPKGKFSRKSIAVQCTSQKSMGDAEKRAVTTSNKVKATVYEQTAHMKVYGKPEATLVVKDGVVQPIVTTTSVGAPWVVTDKKSGRGHEYGSREPSRHSAPRSRRSTAPSGKQPQYLQPATQLM